MSLKRNILANYVGQIYVTLIGILFVPMYVKYMGAETYGLVGFYAMLQAWFQLLDMGLTPTMARETARFRGGAVDALSLRRLLRALEGVFIGIAVLGAFAMLMSSNFIASSWLKVQQLPLGEVQNAVQLMAIIIALRWICGLYRGAISGLEELIWLNGFNIVIATIRSILIVPFLIYVGSTPTHFFGYQVVVAVIEVAILVIQTYRLMPKTDVHQRLPWQWQPLRAVLKFALSIAFVNVVWVLVTQTDKLILSKLLVLSDYAYFTLAVLVASGITIISTPIGGALLPRMIKLNAEGDEAGLIRLYRNATQMVAVIAIPVTLVLAFFSEQVLWAWTGDAQIARKASQALMLYAIGNGILTLAGFPYALQFAKGDLKLHLIGNALFVVIFIPLLIYAAGKFGMVGAGYAWVIANLLPFLVWLPIVHMRFVKGLHSKWLLTDICAIGFPATIVAAVMFGTVTWSNERISLVMEIITAGLVLLIVAVSCSTWARVTMKQLWRN